MLTTYVEHTKLRETLEIVIDSVSTKVKQKIDSSTGDLATITLTFIDTSMRRVEIHANVATTVNTGRYLQIWLILSTVSIDGILIGEDEGNSLIQVMEKLNREKADRYTYIGGVADLLKTKLGISVNA